ncbi:MAG: DUF4912 domain-containing protein [Myxococcaceae bacterium]
MKLSLRELRDLARKHLGNHEARLKTREDLVKALKGAVVGTLEKAVDTALRVAAPPLERRVDNRPTAPPALEPRPAEPVSEGFFVAKVAGENEARRHHMTEEQAPSVYDAGKPSDVYDEHLGELPDRYGEDSVLLLPRDPHTLYVLWDFKDETRNAAAQGLRNPRAVLRVFDNGHPVRDVELALELKSYYLHDVTPGRMYRVEAHFVGEDGQSQRISGPSNSVALPSEGPSSNTEVRFLRIPWGLPLSRLKEFLRDGRARIGAYLGERKFLEQRRSEGPSSATLHDLFSAGERGWTSSPRSGRGR